MAEQTPASKPEVSKELAPSVETAPTEEPALKPQGGGWWTDLLIVGVIVVILLGGIGKAFSDSDLFAQVPPNAADPCPPGGCTRPPGVGCIERPIKGVVTTTGDHLYYVGVHPSYTGIIAMHIERGDRWFCSESSAAAAGFRPAP